MNCRAGAPPAERNWQPERLPYKLMSVKKAYARAGVNVDLANKLKRDRFSRG